jgi:hypothetical protein
MMPDDVDPEQAELIHELAEHSDRTVDRIQRLRAAEAGIGSDDAPKVAKELMNIAEAEEAIGDEVETTDDITIADVANDGGSR